MFKNTFIKRPSSKFAIFFIFPIILSMVVGFSGLSKANEEKPSASPPSQFIQELGDTALMSLTVKDISREAREKRVRKILQKNFDIRTIARFALGTYWREATKPQRKEYMILFENMIVRTYTARFEDYSSQKLKVTGDMPSGKRDFLVFSQIIQEDGPPVNLEWRLRKKDDNLKIIDVVVEGISMSITQRSDFSAVIQRGGGKVDALLTSLRKHENRKT